MMDIRTRLTNQSIIKNKDSTDIRQLRDTQLPLIFRYHQDRDHGSFHVAVSVLGKTRWKKIGLYPGLSCHSARTLTPTVVGRLISQHLQGNSSNIAVENTPNTLDDVLVWYRQRMWVDKTLSNRTKENTRTNIDKHLSPKLGHLQLAELTRANIDKKFIVPMARQYQRSTIQKVFQLLVKIIRLAVSTGLLDEQPCTQFGFNTFVPTTPTSQKRASTGVSPTVVLSCANSASPWQGVLITWLLLHGTRIGETVKMCWQDIDWWQKRWTIPADNTKTKQTLVLPLTDIAIEVLRRYQRLSHIKSVFVFPSRQDAGYCLNSTYASKAIVHVSSALFRAHDLRRLARTQWLDLGVDHIIGEFLLNHQLRLVERAYIHTYADARCREALTIWHTYLKNLPVTESLWWRQSEDKEVKKVSGLFE